MSTNFKHQIYSDISRCEEILDNNDVEMAKELTEEINNVYGNHIKEIHRGITYYTRYENCDHIKDIKLLKRKLEILAAEVKDGRYPSNAHKAGLVLNNNSINYNKNDNSNMNQIQFKFNF